ncbi:EF-hand domain-containing protein [Pseudoalteromonas sp. T1lg23B]|uniref:EF-hand domain-containing protein n=1 Tax=Pseudoalteromonas sp. T1lg23B TaxID=2077097 RepID=UPI001F3728BE|nr:EF-hand domain-containing protein [Pseudoalteromonas sp. T1lg23B]
MMKNNLITIAFFAMAASATAQASEVFTTLDADKDGAISLSESKALPSLMAQFKDLDTDANGSLSAEEFANFKSE